MKLYLPSLLAVIGLSACATQYSEPTADTTHAVLNFVNEPNLNPNELRFVEQRYASVSDQSCDKAAEFVRFEAWDADHKPVRLESGKPVNILAYNIYPGATSGHYEWDDRPAQNCKSLASFTPKKDGNYIVRMAETDTTICQLFVIDYATKESPADLAVKNGFQCGDEI